MNFLQFAVWGSYLTSMGTYLAGAGMASNIGLFYAMQGIVSLFMPALIGIIADRWIEAQRLLGICHGLAALFMFGAGYYAMTAGDAVAFAGEVYFQSGYDVVIVVANENLIHEKAPFLVPFYHSTEQFRKGR